jgi:hypothetical protein
MLIKTLAEFLNTPTEYVSLHQVIINRGAQPEETPEHNAMGEPQQGAVRGPVRREGRDPRSVREDLQERRHDRGLRGRDSIRCAGVRVTT